MFVKTSLALILLVSLATAQLSFDPAVNVPAGTRPSGVVAIDFDGDGTQDLAVVVDTPDRIVFLRQSAGTWSAALGTVFLGANAGGKDLEAADLDGDGDQDLIVALGNQNQVRVLRNDGGGVFTPMPAVAVGNEPRELEPFDRDNDGDVDIAVSSRDSNDVTILDNTLGTLSVAQVVPVGAEPRHLEAGDMDGDGFADIAVAAHDARRVDILRNSGGTFSIATSFTPAFGERPSGITLADTDQDGDLDVACTGGDVGFGLISIHQNLGAMQFAGGAPVFISQEPGAIEAADLDGDGFTDLVAASENGSSLMALAGRAGSAFDPAVQLAVGLRPEDVVLTDLDGDGDVDVACSNRDSGTVSVVGNAAMAPPVNPLTITTVTPPSVGGTGTIRIASPAEPGFSYICAFSGGMSRGFLLPDSRIVPLDFDFLLLLSLDPANGIFVNQFGLLSASGEADVLINVPPQPLLQGLVMYAGFITGDASGTITGISPAAPITIL